MYGSGLMHDYVLKIQLSKHRHSTAIDLKYCSKTVLDISRTQM